MAMRRRSGGGEDCPSGLMASRLRIRRILCFLKHHDLTAAARELEGETGVFFDAVYMEHLLRMGCWSQADGYLHRFLPTPEHRSPQSMFLVIHLRSAWTLAEVAAGGSSAAEFASTFDDVKGPAVFKFRRILHKMHADQPRASMLWKEVAPSAVDSAMDLLYKCPELKGKLHLPRDRPMPWEVTPLIGARGFQRRRNKAADRTPADVVIRAIKRQKRLLSALETDAHPGFPSNAPSSSVALNAKTEPNARNHIIPQGVPSSASSCSVALDLNIEQIAPVPITPREQQKENEGTSAESRETGHA